MKDNERHIEELIQRMESKKKFKEIENNLAS